MSYTKFISDNQCEYLDAQTQNADNMILKVVHIDCQGNTNSMPSKSSMNPNGLEKMFSMDSNSDKIEGFTNGGYSGNLSGVSYVSDKECPVGHTYDGKGCRQICTHCTYRDNEPSSRAINEADICEPYGMFNGIDENGYAICLSKNKQSEYYPLDSYAANAVLVTRNPIYTTQTQRMYI